MISVHLVASPDDYLLELAVSRVTAEVSNELGGVEPEVYGAEVTPETLAVELCSPSLFASSRLLVVPEISAWIDLAGPRGRGRGSAPPAEFDAGAVTQVLADGLPDGIALVAGACCRSRPKGELVSAFERHGTLHWHPLPEPPKPWEDLVVSEEQEAMLADLLSRAAGDVRITAAARRLLIERLGFAPRDLAQEGRKLASAASSGEIDEDLVRALSFPRRRSLDVVWDSVLERQPGPVLDLLAAGSANLLVRDRKGAAVKPKDLPRVVFAQTMAVLQQLLYLRRVVARLGLSDELAPERTADGWWYPRHFSKKIAPQVLSALEEDAPSPLVRPGGRPPKPFRLGGIFKGAGRYGDDELVDAIAAGGPVEAAVRGDLRYEALASWLADVISIR